MERIPRTYDGGESREDLRNTGEDFWAWLQTQPQAAWLNYLRGMNWDNGDTIAADMVRHPDCSRGIASWLFLKSGMHDYLSGRYDPADNIVAKALIARLNGPAFADTALHYDRSEVAGEGRALAAFIQETSEPLRFPVPLALIDNFEGSNQPIGPYPPGIERDLAEIFTDSPGFHSAIWGTFWRSDEAYYRAEDSGGNRWWVDALQLPGRVRINPADDAATRLIKLYGAPGPDADARIEKARVESLAKDRIMTVGWFPRAIAYLAIGCAALIGALHFFGPVAAAIVLVVWLGYAIYLNI